MRTAAEIIASLPPGSAYALSAEDFAVLVKRIEELEFDKARIETIANDNDASYCIARDAMNRYREERERYKSDWFAEKRRADAAEAKVAELQALVDSQGTRLKAIDDAKAAHDAEMARHASYCEVQWNTSADCDCGYPAEEARELAEKGRAK